jgi:hypothetical protein
LTSGVLSIAAVGTDYLAPAAIGVTIQAFRRAALQQHSAELRKAAAYGLVATDAQKHIFHSAVGAHTYTIPGERQRRLLRSGRRSHSSTMSGSGILTISITTDTLIQAGSGSTGSRTLAANGMATALKIGSTKWMISGSGLT